VKTHYVIDKSLRNLIVLDMAGTRGQQIVCPIMAIVDIYTVADDGIDVFPPDVVKILKPSEKDLMFMVVFSESGKLYRFCLVAESIDARVMLAEAVKILRHYVQPAFDNRASTSFVIDTAANQQASVGYFLQSVGVQGGRGAKARILGAKSLPKRVTLASPDCDTVTYLNAYGYRASSDASWKVPPGTFGQRAPVLTIHVHQHAEVAGHTWYMIECTLAVDGDFGTCPTLNWLAPRRLENLRTDLHDRIQKVLGASSYTKGFDKGRHFASRGGLPGTTAQLNLWFSALSDLINGGTAQPAVVAMALWFFEAPVPDQCADKSITEGLGVN